MSKELTAQLLFLAQHFGHRLPDDTVLQYSRMLGYLSSEQISRAISHLVQTFVPTSACPFPTIRHILGACGESIDDHARLAIARLKFCIRKVGQYESICMGDPAMHFIVAASGGWASICLWTDTQWDVNENRLLETYKAAQAAKSPAPVYLPGLSEKESGYFRLYIIPQTGPHKEVLCIGHVPPDVINQLTVSHKKQLEVSHV